MFSNLTRGIRRWFAAGALVASLSGGAVALAEDCESWEPVLIAPVAYYSNFCQEALAYNPTDGTTMVVYYGAQWEHGCFLWDGLALTSLPAPAMFGSSIGHSVCLVYDASRNVFVYKDPLGIQEFNGTGWDFTFFYTGGTQFGAWNQLQMVYTPVHGVILTNGPTLLQYDGGTPKPLKFSGNAPPQRFGHRIAFDTTLQAVVMFGGEGASGKLNDTWKFYVGPDQWFEITPTIAPPAMSAQSFGMTFDPLRHRTVLLTDEGKLWHLDGTHWSLSASSLPAAAGNRRYASISYHASTDTILLFGGLENGNELWKLHRPNAFVFVTESQTVLEGDTACLIAYAVGKELSYQWYNKLGIPMPGQTLPVLVLKSVTPKTAGTYTCVASSPCGTISTDPLMLTVTPKIAGDINGDGKVDQADLGILLANYGMP